LLKLKAKELREFLDAKAEQYETSAFLDDDPVQIPHRFSLPQDQEIIGLLSATIAWGNRKSIIRSALRICALMDEAPYQFVMEHQETDLKRMEGFVHRTFQADDLRFFIQGLRQLYLNAPSLETAFYHPEGMAAGIEKFRREMFKTPHAQRSEKHISSPAKNSAAKRLNMYLRWMVRSNQKGVDFGLWQQIKPADLYCPLDVHSGRAARKLGLLKRKANDWKAAEELRLSLVKLDPQDPVKYDFALFGLGVFEKF
jgi:uncharacterized protein (TIGR02757 family)